MKTEYIKLHGDKVAGWIRCLLLAAVISSTAFGAYAEEFFSDLAGMAHVESTYVSGRFAHNQKYWISRNNNRSMNLEKGFSALYVYACSSTASVTKARQLLESYLKKYPSAELVQRTINGQQEYKIYELFEADKLMEMVIWSEDAPNVAELVVVQWKEGLTPTTPAYPVHN